MTATMAGRLIAAALAAGTGLLTSPPSAVASPSCGARERIVKQLADAFNEKRSAMGLIAADVLLEIFVSPAGTWTVVISNANGLACVVATGEAWTTIERRPGSDV